MSCPARAEGLVDIYIFPLRSLFSVYLSFDFVLIFIYFLFLSALIFLFLSFCSDLSLLAFIFFLSDYLCVRARACVCVCVCMCVCLPLFALWSLFSLSSLSFLISFSFFLSLSSLIFLTISSVHSNLSFFYLFIFFVLLWIISPSPISHPRSLTMFCPAFYYFFPLPLFFFLCLFLSHNFSLFFQSIFSSPIATPFILLSFPSRFFPSLSFYVSFWFPWNSFLFLFFLFTPISLCLSLSLSLYIYIYVFLNWQMHIYLL